MQVDPFLLMPHILDKSPNYRGISKWVIDQGCMRPLTRILKHIVLAVSGGIPFSRCWQFISLNTLITKIDANYLMIFVWDYKHYYFLYTWSNKSVIFAIIFLIRVINVSKYEIFLLTSWFMRCTHVFGWKRYSLWCECTYVMSSWTYIEVHKIPKRRDWNE